MAIFQRRSKRKPSGGRYKKVLKRLSDLGSLASFTKIDEKKVKMKRGRGGKCKETLLSINKINVVDPKTKKCKVVAVTNVVENPANRHLIRRNVMTKGAVVETKIGKVRITSRPGQEGCVNGILIK